HDLTEQQLASLRDRLELVTFDSGKLIFDEYERSDCMYVIRSGLVRVVKRASALIGLEHVRNWKSLGGALLEGEKQPASPRGKIWSLLSEKAQSLLRSTPDASALPEADRQEVLYALNEVLKQRTLADAKELQPIVNDAAVAN